MKPKKILTLALAGVMTLSTLAGCKSGSSDSRKNRSQYGAGHRPGKSASGGRYAGIEYQSYSFGNNYGRAARWGWRWFGCLLFRSVIRNVADGERRAF